MAKYEITLPVSWEMCGTVKVEVEGENLTEAVQKAIQSFNPDKHKLPCGEYVDASFELTDNETEFILLYQQK